MMRMGTLDFRVTNSAFKLFFIQCTPTVSFTNKCNNNFPRHPHFRDTFIDESELPLILENIAIDWYNLNKAEKAVEIFESKINFDNLKPSPSLCNLLTSFSTMLEKLSKYERMQTILKRALTIAEEQNYKPEHCKALYNLSITYILLGNIDCALEYLQKAEQKAREIGNHLLVFQSQHNIGQCLLHRKEYRGAIKKFEEAYNAFRTQENKLECYICLGICYSRLYSSECVNNENFEKSKWYFERGLNLAEEQQHRKNIFVCLSRLGELHIHYKSSDQSASRDLDVALKYLNKAESNAATFVDKRFLYQAYADYFLAKFVSTEKLEERAAALNEAEKWLEKSEDCYDQTWRELKQDIDKITWSDRCVLLTHMIQEIKWISDKRSEALIVAEKFKARSFRDAMRIRNSTIKQFLVDQTDDMKEIAQKLGQPIVYFSNTPDPEYYKCWVINPKRNKIASQGIRLHPEIHSAQNTYQHKDEKLSPKEQNVIVLALIECSKNPNSLRTFNTNITIFDTIDEDYRALYKQMWKNIESDLITNNVLPQKIIVIPDGELWHVMYPLLTDENGTLLLHKHVISLALSISSLKRHKAGKDIEANTALVIGNPDVSNIDEISCPNLPMATAESFEVKNMLESKSLSVKHLTDKTATKHAVLSTLPEVRLFHIASHATDSAASATQLPGCLLLAREPSTDESGILHADEIQSLDLRGLKLAFLNCCYTGEGSVYAEGLIGLARAFLYAGAHNVVVSMRPVSDTKTTCDFAHKFYEKYLETGEADVALNEAQKHMAERGVDAREWGSYYVIRQMLCD